MKRLNVSNVLIVTGLLLTVPALAQTSADSTSPSPMTVQAVHTEGGDSAYNSTATDETVVAADKQQTQGVPAGTQPPQYGAAWARTQQ